MDRGNSNLRSKGWTICLCSKGKYLFLYLLFGGGVFYWSEFAYNEKNNITSTNAHNHTFPSVLIVTDVWDFFAGTFFAMTILTTVGYGNFVPHTYFGKLFTIFYGTVGIPLAGLVLARFSDNFGEKCLKHYEKQRRRVSSEGLAIFLASFAFIFSGFSLFLFLPALIFSFLEDWNYMDSFYFAFVSLTTIGFGDIVAAQHGDVNWLWLYRILTLIWSFYGIGYWLVVAQFITKALKSKRLRLRWKNTKRILSSHADEIKAAIDEHSYTKKQEFLPYKSKVIMDFLLNFGAAITEVEVDTQRTYLPGINALMNQKKGGIAALFNLPIAMTMKNNNQVPETDISDLDTCTHCGQISLAPSTTGIGRSVSGATLNDLDMSRKGSFQSAHPAMDMGLPRPARSRKPSKASLFSQRSKSPTKSISHWEKVDPVSSLTALHYLLESIFEMEDNRVNDIISECLGLVMDDGLKSARAEEVEGIEIKISPRTVTFDKNPIQQNNVQLTTISEESPKTEDGCDQLVKRRRKSICLQDSDCEFVVTSNGFSAEKRERFCIHPVESFDSGCVCGDNENDVDFGV